jgi:hypothetical protein
MKRVLPLVFVLAFAGSFVPITLCSAQQIPQKGTVTFKFLWPQVHPGNYTIVVNADGQMQYDSHDGGLTPPQERNAPFESNAEQSYQARDAASQEPYHIDFRGSGATTQKVFALAERTNYFNGNFDYQKHAIAQNGRKTLIYEGPEHHGSATYNWSEDIAIQQLTSIFQGISETIEAGRRLDFDRRFDKLGLDADLENLEKAVKDGRLYEVQVIAPTLQRLANDRTVLHLAQTRAQHILKAAGLPLVPAGAE